MAQKKSQKQHPKLYTAEQLEKLENFIEETFGEISNYFQEKETSDIKLNIYVIPPTLERHYTTLVTGGMGAHLMNVPESFKDQNLERAELVICLPPSWNLDSDDIEYYWPFHLLKLLSRLPIEENAWLGKGHTVDYCTEFAPNTELSGVILLSPDFGEKSHFFNLSDDDRINFLQIVPLYDCEIQFKNKNGAAALVHEFGENFSRVVDIDRSPAVSVDFANIIDRVEDHSSKIIDKNLNIPEICGANHIAAFLRWIISHKMINAEFTEFFKEELAEIRSGNYDIRRFIMNSLGGELTKEILTEDGQAFADYYYDFYNDDDAPCFPSDVDSVAYDYFGNEKYNCEEFGDEAYLFVPYDDNYFKAINKYINKNYRKFEKLQESQE